MNQDSTISRTTAGLITWLALLIYSRNPTWWSDSSVILLFGMLVVAPVALTLARKPGEDPTHLFQTAKYLQPFAAFISAASFLIPAGVLAGTLAIAWAPVSVLLALAGLNRIREHSRTELEEWSIDLALIFLPLSAFFLWAERMRMTPFGFTGQAALALSAHLFFTGFSGLTLAGLIGRNLRKSSKSPADPFGFVFLLVLGAAAIYWQYNDSPLLQAVVLVIQAAAYLGIGLLLAMRVNPAIQSAGAKFFLLFSSASVALSMGILLAAAAGVISSAGTLPPSLLMTLHGWTIAVGFAGCGLVGFALARKT